MPPIATFSSASLRRGFTPVAVIALLALAYWALQRELVGLTWVEVRAELTAIRPLAIAIGLLLTAVSYTALIGYDTIGLRHAGVTLERAKVALAATAGFAFSQGLGFPLLTGAPIRYRLYSGWGLSAETIGLVISLYLSTFLVGFAAAAGLAFLAAPVDPPDFIPLPAASISVLGGLLLLGLTVFLGWSISGRGQIRLSKITIPIPGPRLVVAQIVVGLLDWITGSLVLWALLPDGHALGFGVFFTTYLLAQMAGWLSRVPAGLGVFEAVLLSFLPVGPALSQVLASLLAFRVIYYLVPLFLAAIGLGYRELRAQKETLDGPVLGVAQVVSRLVPSASAALTFVLGGLLLLSGSVPLPVGRLGALDPLVPLPLLELSHFLGSLVGMALLVLARGLQRRLDGAYQVALVLMIVAAALATTRDLNLGLMLACLIGAGVLYASRREFYRPASLLDEPFSPSWILAIGAALTTALWLGYFAFQNVEYSSDLWWQFALRGDAPRFLRAMVGTAAGLALFVTARLMRSAPLEPPSATRETLKRVAPIVDASASPEANLVFLGDKEVIISESGRSFLMFGVSGSTWVAMGDPIGDPSEFEEMAWQFRERADRAGDRIVFYEIGPTWLPLYIDLGLAFFKLGEKGRVSLGGFSLEGSSRADLRKAMRRLEKVGGGVEVVPKEAVEPLLPRLRAISDEWLESKNVREKRFSLGRFEEEYVRRFPAALVKVKGRVVAFATLLIGSSREELSIDLMRYSDDAPGGVMDALFGHLLLWGVDRGYSWFNVGMAPFSGMETHRLAPAWQKLGAALFQHGEHLYNFQGLRDYKEKFDPIWEPRYLAAPPGLGMPMILSDVTALISGGLRGTVMR